MAYKPLFIRQLSQTFTYIVISTQAQKRRLSREFLPT